MATWGAVASSGGEKRRITIVVYSASGASKCFSRQPARAFIQKIAAATLTPVVAMLNRNCATRIGVHHHHVDGQPEVIVGTWRAVREEAPEVTEAEVRETLVHLEPMWAELFPAEQARLVQLLVERVTIGPTGADIELLVDGLSSLARDLRRGGSLERQSLLNRVRLFEWGSALDTAFWHVLG